MAFSHLVFMLLLHFVAAAKSFPPNNYLIVGAGPVGLWTSLQIKFRNPAAQITILEKRSEYTRNAVLRVPVQSFSDGQDDAGFFDRFWRPKLEEIASWSTVGKKSGMMSFSSSSSSSSSSAPSKKDERIMVACWKLENLLKTVAIEQGVRFERFELTEKTVVALRRMSENFDIVIGADGRHSNTRDLFMSPNPSHNEMVELKNVYQHTIVLKFTIRDLGDLSSRATLNKLQKRVLFRLRFHAVLVNFGKLVDEMMPVTITIPIKQNVFDTLKRECAGKTKCTAYKLDDKNRYVRDRRVPRKLAHDIKTAFVYLASSKDEENRLKTTVDLALVQVDAYRAKKSSSSQTNTVLVGDAVMGIPYFRGLSNGLMTGNYVARLLSSTPNIKTFKEFQAAYETALNSLFELENENAKKDAKSNNFKDRVVRLGKSLTSGSLDLAESILPSRLWEWATQRFTRYKGKK